MNATTYKNWIEAKTSLDIWKKKEANLRTKICDELLIGKTVGTHNFTKGRYMLKAVKKISISIDEELLSFVWDDLSTEEQACVKFKPSIISKEYKNCDEHIGLDQAITTKPAMPSLSIEVAPE